MATYDLTSSIPAVKELKKGDILNCPYSGEVKEITLPPGTYKLECWGAQGGNYTSTNRGGAGGYSKGTITLQKRAILYLYAGGQPAALTSSGIRYGGFNGGGKAAYHTYNGTTTRCQAGGGGSDVRVNQDSLYARVIVAGGGGGCATTNAFTTKYGGGSSSGSPSSTYVASQTAAGSGGSFGVGGDADTSGTNYKYAAGGGGGGWYGGGASTSRSDTSSSYRGYNGGGSGYVYTSESAVNYPSGCLLNPDYYLLDSATIAGNSSFTDYDGSTVTGHTGHGAVRITIIEIKSLPVSIKAGGVWKEASTAYVKINDTWKEINAIGSNINDSWKI